MSTQEENPTDHRWQASTETIPKTKYNTVNIHHFPDPRPIGETVRIRYKAMIGSSFTDDLDQHPFLTPSVELSVKNLLPSAEV
jgi:hypothetical protein